MKSIFCLILFFVMASYCDAQGVFTLNSPIDSLSVKVNGEQYQLDSIGTKIKTNYPKFDTLVFLGDFPNSDSPVICNFKPDTLYSISGACCGSLDVTPASRFENDSLSLWDYDLDFYKIQDQLMSKPFISIRTLKNPKDSVYAWHADAACMTENRLINTTPWELGVPPKCFYWSNITTILFYKTDGTMVEHEETDLEEFLQTKNIVELSSISFLLFDNERFVIIYDEKRDRVKIEYE